MQERSTTTEIQSKIITFVIGALWLLLAMILLAIFFWLYVSMVTGSQVMSSVPSRVFVRSGEMEQIINTNAWHHLIIESQSGQTVFTVDFYRSHQNGSIVLDPAFGCGPCHICKTGLIPPASAMKTGYVRPWDTTHGKSTASNWIERTDDLYMVVQVLPNGSIHPHKIFYHDIVIDSQFHTRSPSFLGTIVGTIAVWAIVTALSACGECFYRTCEFFADLLHNSVMGCTSG